MSKIALIPITEEDFREFGDDQGFKYDEGFTLDCLVTYEHEGRIIVNPYSHTQGDPAEMFGAEKMDEWRREAAELMIEWRADNVCLSSVSTAELEKLIYANVEIQKRNPFNSEASTHARFANGPLMAEMAKRPDAPRVR